MSYHLFQTNRLFSKHDLCLKKSVTTSALILALSLLLSASMSTSYAHQDDTSSLPTPVNPIISAHTSANETKANNNLNTQVLKTFDLAKINAAYLTHKDYVKYLGRKLTNQLVNLQNQITVSKYGIGKASTMDLQYVDKYTEYLNPQLGASITTGDQATLGIYLPLISKNQLTTAQKLNFITNYYQAWNSYAPQAKYALALIDDKQNLGKLSQNLTTTFLFITSDHKAINTPIYTSHLTTNSDKQLVLKSHSTVIANVIDLQGITNQSNLEIYLTNFSDQPQVIANTLNYYLDAVVDNALSLWQQKSLDHTFNPIYRQVPKTSISSLNSANSVNSAKPKAQSNVNISSQNSNVTITGGSIKAQNIQITSGHNIVINNAQIEANKVNLDAQHQIDLTHNKIHSQHLKLKAPIINNDNYQAVSLDIEQNVYSKQDYTSNYDLPRIFGINRYLVSVLDYKNLQFASQPIIPLSLIAAISNQKNLSNIVRSWQNNYHHFLPFAKQFLNQFSKASYLSEMKFPYLSSQYQLVRQLPLTK